MPQENSINPQDYVNAFVINEADEILILEEMKNGRSWSSWQMIGKNLEQNEDPIHAIQQTLLERTGYTCENWTYLGTFVIDDTKKTGAGHFFCANAAEKTTNLNQEDNQANQLKQKWVSKNEVKQALLDGRIAVINHAVVTSLAMMMCNHQI